MYGVRKWSKFILLHVAVQFSQHHLLKKLFFPWVLFSALLKISWPCICGSISRFSILLIYWSLIDLSVFVPVPYCLDDSSFEMQLEVENCDASSFGFLFPRYFGYLGVFSDSIQVLELFVLFCEECWCYFNRDCIEYI